MVTELLLPLKTRFVATVTQANLGQCSAGTLPVAWIDEGPGPPRCPPPSYADVLHGGPGCTGRLTELLETDALAARITCEFTEVLIRYDCGQPYSIIHHCEDCKMPPESTEQSHGSMGTVLKGHPESGLQRVRAFTGLLSGSELCTVECSREAYRRWGCSVFIPYFTSRDDIKSVNNKTGDRDSDRATQGKSNAIFGDAANKQTEPNMNDANKQQLVKNISITVKRRPLFAPSMRASQILSVPWLVSFASLIAFAFGLGMAGLPWLGAHSLPSKVLAGTSHCSDSILTSKKRANNCESQTTARPGCCYDYCGLSPIDGLCARCDPLHNETRHPDSAALALSSEPPAVSASCPSITTPTSSSSHGVQSWIAMVAVLTVGTELVAWTKQLVHLLVVL
uniref:Uncharacterized protein n=1 Tax=Anopheles coluzzii TaxID=1518534 RepID=A0A8W7PGV7_ANOCL